MYYTKTRRGPSRDLYRNSSSLYYQPVVRERVMFSKSGRPDQPFQVGNCPYYAQHNPSLIERREETSQSTAYSSNLSMNSSSDEVTIVDDNMTDDNMGSEKYLKYIRTHNDSNLESDIYESGDDRQHLGDRDIVRLASSPEETAFSDSAGHVLVNQGSHLLTILRRDDSNVVSVDNGRRRAELEDKTNISLSDGEGSNNERENADTVLPSKSNIDVFEKKMGRSGIDRSGQDSISIKDILIADSQGCKKKEKGKNEEQGFDHDGKTTSTNSKKENDNEEIQVLESKIYGRNAVSMSVNDIFRRMKPAICRKDYSGDQSLIISIKATKAKLAKIKARNNKNNEVFWGKEVCSKAREKSLWNDNSKSLQYGKSRFVTLKMSPQKLSDATKLLRNPFFTRGTLGGGTKSAREILNSMRDCRKSQSRLKNFKDSRSFDLPSILREHFHVKPRMENNTFSNIPCIFKEKKNRSSSRYHDLGNGMFFSNLRSVGKEFSPFEFKNERFKFDEFSNLICQNIRISNHRALRRLRELILSFFAEYEVRQSVPWYLLQPQSMDELLISGDAIKRIKSWIAESFCRLESQSRRPRDVLTKQKKKRKISPSVAGDWLVFDDQYLNDNEALVEEDFFPLMIIHGPIGTGKSSAVYTAMKEIQGYVFEINTGQARSRKDIINTLRETSTTQLVYRDDKAKEFQKGVIFLEDCDILLENDKNFWVAVNEILNISRRPIVITCSELSSLPQNLIDLAAAKDAIIDLGKGQNGCDIVIEDYFWLCCLSQGLYVDKQIMKDLLKKNKNKDVFDLRKVMMECQMMCQRKFQKDPDGIVLTYQGYKQESPMNTGVGETDDSSLYDYVTKNEILSQADVISASPFSCVEQDEAVDDFLSLRYIESKDRYTEVHELNIGDYITNITNTNKTEPATLEKAQEIRKKVNNFIGSRSEPIPKFVQEMYATGNFGPRTRFQSNEQEVQRRENTIPVTSDSTANTLALKPFLLEFAPFARYWHRYQDSLDRVEMDSREKLNVSVKNFIGWRQFQDDSRSILDTFM